MAINQENKININVEAEKMAFSDKIAVSTPYRDMAKPSEEIKVSPLAFDFSKPNSFNPFEFEKGGVNLQKENPIILDSQPLKFDQSINFNLSNESSLMAGMGDSKNLESVSSLLSSQKLLNTTLLQKTGMDSLDINKQVNKIIGNTVTPALENMSQYVQQMSNLNTDHKNLHDELPTISPTNLAFVDRSAVAMDKPGWA